MPVDSAVPPLDAAYQLTVPALAAALNVTVPAPLREPLVVDAIVGIALTVTVTTEVGSELHARLLWVAIVVLRYCVVAVSPDGASYVAAVAPLIVPQLLNGLTALSHR